MWGFYGKCIISIILIVFLQAAFIIALVSERKKRIKVESELLNLNKSLESLVEERTRKLQEIKSRLEKENRELDYSSRIDTLTKLYNRRHMEERLQAEHQGFIGAGKVYSVMMIDVDDFKRINDRYGHTAGDTILKKIANILRKEIRESDVGARWGGEEFLLLLPGLKEEDTLSRAEDILNKIKKETYSYNGIKIPITITIGVATIDKDETIEQLIDRADHALYSGKNTGKDKVVGAG